MSLTLYCNTFSDKTPLHHQYNQKTLVCGSHFLKEDEKNICLTKGFLLDNTGNNISGMNPILGDLTGLYWVWKNTSDEFVGTNQYRRFYDERHINSFLPVDTKTLFVSQFLRCDFNVWSQYINSHGELGVKILSEASRLKKIPLTKKMVDSLYESKVLSPCNMFFAERRLFESVCKILFEIIFELYQGTKFALNFIQNGIHAGRNKNDKRLLAFLAERVLNILYLHSNHFFGNIKIQPINYATIDQTTQ